MVLIACHSNLFLTVAFILHTKQLFTPPPPLQCGEGQRSRHPHYSRSKHPAQDFDVEVNESQATCLLVPAASQDNFS